MEEITIDIDAEGNVKIEGHGIVGPDCETLTKEIEKALGTVEKRTKKREYHTRPTVRRKAGA
jgi:hypothetical protein